jgi:23S rRNA pseudouridine2605 synthase
MPRKKKIVEPTVTDAPGPGALAQPGESPDATAASEVRIDLEAEHRMQAESPAPARDAEAEQEAQAIDTFEEAFDSAEPLGASVEDLAGDKGAAKKTAAKKSKSPRRTRKAKELAEADVSRSDAVEAEVPADSAPDASGEAPAAPDLAREERDAEYETGEEAHFTPEPRPPAKLERLQKILSQAGVASRRHAEELITQGRVQVNGQIVTELGSKADPARDHIRVDGKLLQGAERLRYFVLNKPRGFVTTVSDPEGRPTVMEFFAKKSERLYPVGRLDYQSEGLLLVTNDGDLANKLTRAASGVEKTYLVKVSGRPTEEELDRLREGVSIDRVRPGEGRVTTAPATIRQVRQGANPWYEVVLIEGRNRELRKMFEEIGHHLEKIRRVGYGPLVLDQEPGKFRELEPAELVQLRLAAEGKWHRPKAREHRRSDAGVRAGRPDRGEGRRQDAGFNRKPEEQRRPGRFAERPARQAGDRARDWEKRPPGRPQPDWQRGDRSARPPARFNAGEGPGSRRPYGNRPAAGFAGRGQRRPEQGGSRREGEEARAWNRPPGGDREFRPGRRGPGEATGRFDRPRHDRDMGDRDRNRGAAPRPPRSAQFRPGEARPERPRPERPRSERPRSEKPRSEKPRSEKPRFERSDSGRGDYRGSKPLSRGFSGARPAQKPDWKKKSGAANRPGPESRMRPPSRSGRPGFGGPKSTGSRSTGPGSGAPTSRGPRLGGRGPASRSGPGRSDRGRTGPGRGGDHRGGRGKR